MVLCLHPLGSLLQVPISLASTAWMLSQAKATWPSRVETGSVFMPHPQTLRCFLYCKDLFCIFSFQFLLPLIPMGFSRGYFLSKSLEYISVTQLMRKSTPNREKELRRQIDHVTGQEKCLSSFSLKGRDILHQDLFINCHVHTCTCVYVCVQNIKDFFPL